MLTYTQIAFNGAMALLMGLLVGIEREHAHKDIPWFAGIRTFPLITLFGFLCGLAALAGQGWILPVGLAGVSAVAVAAYMVRSQGPYNLNPAHLRGQDLHMSLYSSKPDRCLLS